MMSEAAFEDPMKHEQDPVSGWNDKDASGMDPLSRFAGGIAHDFNNLLTVINGYSQLLLSEEPDAGKFTGYAEEILRAGSKAAEIVEMLLACGGRQPFAEETFEVNTLVEKMRGFLDLFLGETISLRCRLCGEPGPVCGDRGQLEWALTSLFMNAKEAMPEGGRIDLETRFIRDTCPDSADLRYEPPRFEISIRDTGRGMVKEVLDRIFDPYFSTKRRSSTPGLGLGLACTKGIVRQFGGSICAESVPGAGTLVRIRLPIAGSARDLCPSFQGSHPSL